MRAVRVVVRVTIFMLVGFAISFGSIAVFKAQATLDELVELYVKGLEAPPQPPQLATASARPVPAPGSPGVGHELVPPPPPMDRAVGPATDAPAPGEVDDTVGSSQLPPLASPQADEPPRTGRIAARWPQITPDATPIETAATRVSDAQSVVNALPDRAPREAPPIGSTSLASTETLDHDDGRFISVKVHRTGAESSVHRVPREFPKVPREW